MSELRVDNIVSADGNTAPTYSQGVTVAAGKTFTNSGDFTTAGNSSFSGIAGRNLYTTATSNPSNSWNNVGFSAGRLY